MSYGAYFATQPSTRTYIDTSQPLNGFGAAEGGDPNGDMLAIYDGVAGFGAAPSPGCGCSGARGRLAGYGGFGDEVMPDGTTTGTPPTVGVTQGTNIQTALIALLVVGSVAAVGYYLLGGAKGGSPMRANGRKGARSGFRGRVHDSKLPWMGSHADRWHLARGGTPRAYSWEDGPDVCYLSGKGNTSIAQVEKDGGRWVAYVKSPGGVEVVGSRKTCAQAKRLIETRLASAVKMVRNGKRVGTRSMPTRRKGAVYVSTYCNFAHDLKTGRPRRHQCIVIPPAALRAERDGDSDRANEIMQARRYGMRRNGAPAYLLSKHGKTTKRQAHAAAHYLAEARWHGAPKRVKHWSGKHLAHKRFNTNGRASSRQKYVVLWRHSAGTRLPGKATVATVQRLCAAKGVSATIATELGSGHLMHIGTVDKQGHFHGAQRV